MRYRLAASLLVLTLCIPGAGAEPPAPRRASWCGTGPTGMAAAAARHRYAARKLRLKGGAVALRHGPLVRQAGKIAVIEDDGTLVAERNLFDLEGAAIEFRRQGAGLSARRVGTAMSMNLGSPLVMKDDDAIAQELPFDFHFYGERYTQLFVNSDGNLTFGRGDGLPTARSLTNLLDGPPRIAVFYDDLDPSNAPAGGGVFVSSNSSRVRITWLDVPEFFTSNRNTFQVTLYPSGRILMTWDHLATDGAVVGTSPGDGSDVDLVDLSDALPFGPSGVAIAERFSAQNEVDDLAVARAFFEGFRDVYDQLVVWLDFPADLDGAFAFELNVKNDVRGIGLNTFDLSGTFGSDGRLESYLQMGPLAQYAADPRTNVLGTNSTLDVLGHEAGHRWLARVQFQEPGGANSTRLLGRAFAHWSFHHDTDASFLEGNDIEDNGGGMFTTVGATSRYSALDRYLMGFIPAGQVPPFFYVDHTSGPADGTSPRVGVTIRGTRRDVTVGQVIAAEGPRVPSSADAQRRFRMAFVLLALPGRPPSQASIDRVNEIRRLWPNFFRQATGGKGKVRTGLKARQPAE